MNKPHKFILWLLNKKEEYSSIESRINSLEKSLWDINRLRMSGINWNWFIEAEKGFKEELEELYKEREIINDNI